MDLLTWSRSNLDYTRKLVNSAFKGARSGEEGFLNGRSLAPFLNHSMRKALRPAAIGACIGAVSCFGSRQHTSTSKRLGACWFGFALGLGVGMAWENRRLLASVTSGARKKINLVRDEHWLEMNPIDYA
ncbi:MAG TPA: hypothetical protein VEV41_01745 [Terriglobales bacterium]|nr:hypothetical protein [Terriglobales bacterium]